MEIDVLKEIDVFFDKLNDADEIMCGCGCKQSFD